MAMSTRKSDTYAMPIDAGQSAIKKIGLLGCRMVGGFQLLMKFVILDVQRAIEPPQLLDKEVRHLGQVCLVMMGSSMRQVSFCSLMVSLQSSRLEASWFR